MKKTSLLLILLFVFASLSHAQLISERTDGKVVIGADVFTDISTGKAYENFSLRDINQGVSVYSMFNFKFEKTPHYASVGVGYTFPAKWWNGHIQNLRIYVACDNVWYWSKRQGFDPRGGSNNYYAPIRTISGGVTLTF